MKPGELSNDWKSIAEFGVCCTLAALLILAALWLTSDVVSW